MVSIEGSWKNEWQCFVLSVPVVLKAKGAIGAEFSGTLGIDSDNAIYLNSDLDFTLPQITVSAGVGVKKLADLSVYGSAANNIHFNFATPYTTATLSGEVGLSAKLLFLSAKMKILSGSWEYYNSLNVNRRATPRFLSSSQAFATVQDESSYAIDRSHLSAQSEWLGGKTQTLSKVRSLYSANNASAATLLQSDVYDNAKPQIAVLNDGRKIMVWTADIAARSDYNHTAAVFSLYTPDTNSWSEPVIISDDGTADFSPTLVSDGTAAYVSWCDSNTIFDGEPTVSDIASHSEISVAAFDVESGTFKTKTTLTNNAYYDSNPELFLHNGNCYVSWVENSNNSPLSMTGTNRLCYKLLSEDAVHTIASMNTPITDQKIGLLDDNVTVAFITDNDGDLLTTNDMQMYTGVLGTSPSATGTTSEQGNLIFHSIGGTDKLLYYKNGNVCAVNSQNSAEETLISDIGAKDFEIVSGNGQTAILCSIQSTDSDTDNASLYAYLYYDNKFSLNPVCVCDANEAYIDGANGYIDEQGNFCVVYSQKAITYSTDDFTEHTSLYNTTITPKYDLTIVDTVYSDEGIKFGENMPVTVTVKNNGLFAVNGFDIAITDLYGSTLFTVHIDKSLEVGEEAEITFDMPFPDISVLTDYTLTIQPSGSEDCNIEDNSTAFRIGYSDISLVVEETLSGNAQGATLNITNNGRNDESVTLVIYDGDENGEMLDMLYLGTVSSGETAAFKYDAQYLRQLESQYGLLCFQVSTSNGEYYKTDNNALLSLKTAMITLADNSQVPYYYDINEDGSFNIKDLVRLKKLLISSDNAEQNAGKDITGDILLNALDLTAIRKKLLGF